jgi:predicted  nucleic acid-binding Zn-ribbon protein
MHPDDDSQTTLSKWPFILGDALLVATSLAIAILGDWQLTNWQVASCVISVALGAALFVLPYVVEFQVRVREEREDRGAELRILHRHVANGREELEAAAERIEAIEAALTKLAQSAPDLSAPLEALDQKLEPVAQAQAGLNKKLEALVKQVDGMSGAVEAKPDSNALKVLETDIASVKEELVSLSAKLAEPASEAKEVGDKEAEAEGSKETKAPKTKPEKRAPKAIERPTRSPRERREPEARLLKRAIDEKQDNSSAAVSRIIESKPKAEPAPEVISKREPATLEQAKEPSEISPKLTEEKPKSKPNTKKASEEGGTDSKPAADAPKPVTPEEDKPAVKKKAVESTQVKAEPVPEEDMFGDTVPAQVTKRVKTKKSDTAVIASVFIGIGNKPFVRGSGAGLNWESGVEMEFEEIGKWRWIPPADLDRPIEIQLYRNDEDADSTGKYTLEPGQQLDLSPVF